MAKCSFCDEQTSMPFKCKFCEQSFCSKHRLPENHDCQGLENYKQQSREEGKVGYDVIRKDKQTDSNVAGRARSTGAIIGKVTRALPSPLFGGRKRDLPVTYILLGIMFAIFLAQLTFSQFSSYFVLAPEQVLTRPWTLITSMFLHASPMHLLVNAIVLFSFGTEVERILGDAKFLMLVFGAGIASALGFTLSGILFNMGSAVGISGALFGIVAFLAVIRPEVRVLAFFIIPLKIRTAVAFFGALDTVNLVMQFLGIPGVYSILLGIEVASAGHLAGLVTGLIYGYHVKDRYGHRRPQNLMGMYRQFGRV